MEFPEWQKTVGEELDAMNEDLKIQPARPHDTYELLVRCGAYMSRLAEIYASPTGDCAQSFVARKFQSMRAGNSKKTYSIDKELKFTPEFIFAEAIKERLRGVKQIAEGCRSLLADDRSSRS